MCYFGCIKKENIGSGILFVLLIKVLLSWLTCSPGEKNIKAIQICYIKACLAAVLFRTQELIKVDAGQLGDVHLKQGSGTFLAERAMNKTYF